MTRIQEMIREQPEQFGGSEINDDGEEVLVNKERGCGFLDRGKGYLRADGIPGGSLPAFAAIPEPVRVPYKEDHFRTWKNFPGIQFELSLIERAADLDPEQSSAMEYVSALSNSEQFGPEGEVWRHIKRLAGSSPLEDGDHYGNMPSAKSHDIIMFVGETYYPHPEDFIEETRERGLNKAIAMSKRNPPPEINPGKTRLWLIHPKGIDNFPGMDDEEMESEGLDPDSDRYTPAIIGYTYLTRAIYTRESDELQSEYVETLAATDKIDIVEVGEPIPAEPEDEEEEEPSKAEKAAEDPDQADLETASNGGSEDE